MVCETIKCQAEQFWTERVQFLRYVELQDKSRNFSIRQSSYSDAGSPIATCSTWTPIELFFSVPLFAFRISKAAVSPPSAGYTARATVSWCGGVSASLAVQRAPCIARNLAGRFARRLRRATGPNTRSKDVVGVLVKTPGFLPIWRFSGSWGI